MHTQKGHMEVQSQEDAWSWETWEKKVHWKGKVEQQQYIVGGADVEDHRDACGKSEGNTIAKGDVRLKLKDADHQMRSCETRRGSVPEGGGRRARRGGGGGGR